MNRKLHNTVTALAATTGLLVLGLMAAHPTVPAPTTFDAEMARVERTRNATLAAERIEARAKLLEARLAETTTTSDKLGEIAGFAAEAATIAAIAAAFDQAEAIDANVEPAKPARKRASRATVAMPYFSFAPRG